MSIKYKDKDKDFTYDYSNWIPKDQNPNRNAFAEDNFAMSQDLQKIFQIYQTAIDETGLWFEWVAFEGDNIYGLVDPIYKKKYVRKIQMMNGVKKKYKTTKIFL